MSRHFACDVSRQRLNLMLDNVLVLSHCNMVHNTIKTAQICKVAMCKDVWPNLGCSLLNYVQLPSQLRVTISLSFSLSLKTLSLSRFSLSRSSLSRFCAKETPYLSLSKSLKVSQSPPMSQESRVGIISTKRTENDNCVYMTSHIGVLHCSFS